MSETKPVSALLASHFKLSKDQSQKTKEEQKHMRRTPYASVVRILMYAMIYTILDISHVVGVINRYITNPDKRYWEVVKWILK